MTLYAPIFCIFKIKSDIDFSDLTGLIAYN